MEACRYCSMWPRLCRLRCARLSYRRNWVPVVCLCVAGIFFGLTALVSLAYYFRHQLFDTFVKCSDADARKFIQDFCELYEQGVITGALCRPLCETGEVQYDRCTNFHAGKEVHLMNCTSFCMPHHTIAAVLKSAKINVTTILEEQPDFLLPGDEQNDIVSMLTQHVQELVRSELGFLPFAASDTIRVMWDENGGRYLHDPSQKNAAYRTVMLLMEQPEYKIMKALKHTGTVPHIYGTCGPMFLEESCPSGPLDVPLTLFSSTNSDPAPSSSRWQDKASAAISLLQLLQHFDYGFSQPLHTCDVKGSNFGVCADGSVKMIDMDSVFFNTTMYNIFNLSTCRTHEDCNFFDCGGWCNMETGQCLPVRTNNNLQLVCGMLAGPFPALFDAGGVLTGAPAWIAKELRASLQECIAPTMVDKDIQLHKPPQTLQRRIIGLLQQSISN